MTVHEILAELEKYGDEQTKKLAKSRWQPITSKKQ